MALNVVHNTAAMAEYDLTPVLSQYLDRHLIFPLLEFLLVQEVRSLMLALLVRVQLLTLNVDGAG